MTHVQQTEITTLTCTPLSAQRVAALVMYGSHDVLFVLLVT
jgi:hypothetical protein